MVMPRPTMQPFKLQPSCMVTLSMITLSLTFTLHPTRTFRPKTVLVALMPFSLKLGLSSNGKESGANRLSERKRSSSLLMEVSFWSGSARLGFSHNGKPVLSLPISLRLSVRYMALVMTLSHTEAVREGWDESRGKISCTYARTSAAPLGLSVAASCRVMELASRCSLWVTGGAARGSLTPLHCSASMLCCRLTRKGTNCFLIEMMSCTNALTGGL
mmetsp:Transcript_47750/g.119454  ORF Transcript_47750/g.119454 Transcript_47750/m.119454 type:complete len:216 (+) Transcript_47750:754-1401(+)